MPSDQREPDYGKVILVDFSAPNRGDAPEAPVSRPALKDGDGGGTSGGMSDDWKISVNGQLAQLHGDVRKLMGGIVTLALLGAGAYVAVANKTEGLAVGQATLIEKVSVSDKKIDGIDAKIDRLESKLDQLAEGKPRKP